MHAEAKKWSEKAWKARKQTESSDVRRIEQNERGRKQKQRSGAQNSRPREQLDTAETAGAPRNAQVAYL